MWRRRNGRNLISGVIILPQLLRGNKKTFDKGKLTKFVIRRPAVKKCQREPFRVRKQTPDGN